jgi:hypothetical protein
MKRCSANSHVHRRCGFSDESRNAQWIVTPSRSNDKSNGAGLAHKLWFFLIGGFRAMNLAQGIHKTLVGAT